MKEMNNSGGRFRKIVDRTFKTNKSAIYYLVMLPKLPKDSKQPNLQLSEVSPTLSSCR